MSSYKVRKSNYVYLTWYKTKLSVFLCKLNFISVEYQKGGKESACNAGDLGSIPGSGEGNGNPSSILAWEIPWTEEPGGLQSMGSQRVGHN